MVAKVLKRFWIFVVGYFNPSPPKTRRVRQTLDTSEYGEFYFRGTILDQLERYFTILKRMRAGDREAYDLHAKVGAHIVPEANYRDLSNRDLLDPWWLTNRPAFGMVMYGASEESRKIDEGKKHWVPFAVYFRKYSPAGIPPSVQPAFGGDVYGVTVYWDTLSDGRRKKGAPTEFAVFIGGDGGVTLLKTIQDRSVSFRSKGGRDKGSYIKIPCRRWGVDPFFEKWASQHDESPEKYLACIFIEAANLQMMASNSFVQVRVKKRNLSALFGVNILRTPYFFDDRDSVVGTGGHKKRIFHIVRTHVRKSGSVVRTHFRGLREFKWNGYDIKITVPGWHHVSVSEFDVGSYDEETTEEETISNAELGDTIQGWEESGLGAYQR